MEPLSLTSLSLGASSIPVITAPEELDLATASLVREAVVGALAADVSQGVVVDMSIVAFVDSRGMAELLAIRKLMRGQPVRLVGVGKEVLGAMQLLGIDILFELHPSIDDLQRAIREVEP